MKQSRRWLLAAFASLPPLTSLDSAFAQPAERISQVRTNRLRAVVEAYTPEHGFMGSVAVVADGQLLLNKSYGFAEAEWGVANTPDAKFRIGSLTKQFTAALVLLLQEDGRLALSDRLDKHLPGAPEAWREITLAQLLGHTSGIPDFTRVNGLAWAMTPRQWSEELGGLGRQPLNFTPGSQFQYSSSNYEIIGVLLEKASGKPLGGLLRERILTPLGMHDTGLDADSLFLARRAEGYARVSGNLVRAQSESLSVPWAAGSMYSTTGDLVRWQAGLFGGRLLSPASLRSMTSPGLGGYGLGVMAREIGGVRLVDHSGAITGFGSYLAHLPERRVTVAVLSNVGGPQPTLIGMQLVSVMLGQAVILPTERKAAPITKAELDRFVGRYEFPTGLAVVFRRDGETLTSIANGSESRMIFEGAKDGRPTFYVPDVDAAVAFVDSSDGDVGSAVLTQGGQASVGVRR